MNSRLVRGLALALGVVASAGAQSYVLANGRALEARGFALRNGVLTRVIVDAGGEAEVGVPVSAVVRLDWPVPPGLVDARAALTRGDAERAGIMADAVMRDFEPWATLPGAWWSEAAWVRAQAWLLAGDVVAAGEVARRLAERTGEVAMRQRARLLVASGDLATGRVEAAEALVRSIWLDGVAAEVEPEAHVVLGRIALARGRAEEAIEAFLQVPTFFGRRDDLWPEAMLGAARGYALLGDQRRARQAAGALERRFPESSAAEQGRKDFLDTKPRTK